MTAALLAAGCLDLLGRVEGPIAVTAPAPLGEALRNRVPIANDGEAVRGAICVFLREPADADRRTSRLSELAARLPAGAPLVVVDYNQPRTWWRRVRGALALASTGHLPARARHLVAREVHAHGFTIERLRLADNERIQLILARRRP